MIIDEKLKEAYENIIDKAIQDEGDWSQCIYCHEGDWGLSR